MFWAKTNKVIKPLTNFVRNTIKMVINKKKISSLQGNFAFWVIFFLYSWLPEASINDKNYETFLYALYNLPLVIGITYYTIYVSIDRFYLKEKYWQFWLSLLGSLAFSGIIRRFVMFRFCYPMLWPDKLTEDLWFFPKMVVGSVQVHLIAGVGVMIYLLSKWMEQQHVSEKLIKEKLAAQLELLKSQVQPHFIFNTLNNIYMLSLKNSPQTSDMIYRLSALLSYMLYDAKEETIGIEKEVDYIKNYINLEKIRYGERLDVQLNVYNNVKGVRVPPLLVLPLVENAFKHGVSRSLADSWVHIDISLKNKSLIFKVENSISEEKVQTNGFGNGLGLENLKKRLEILYPNTYELKTMQDECSYLAILRLDFAQYTEGVSSKKGAPIVEIVS
jgi:two-component system, LytTR family, sensor kinase